jgi:hypothetical protein
MQEFHYHNQQLLSHNKDKNKIITPIHSLSEINKNKDINLVLQLNNNGRIDKNQQKDKPTAH